MAQSYGKGKDPMNRFAYDLIVWLVNIMIELFFRELHPRSAWRIPREGPVLFVAAPHANQFVDPLILMRVVRFEAKRRVSFLIAAKSMGRAFIGRMAKLVGSVPVSRPMDDARPQPGKIYLPDPEHDPCLVRGYGTNFEQDKFKVGGRLVLPTVNHEAASAEIQAVLGPTELRVKKPFEGEVAANQLTGRRRIILDGQSIENVPNKFEGTAWKFAQKVDQSGIYRFVADVLGQGGCIGMFPEGGSHDRPELLPLKAGVAIMALETLKKYPNCDLKVVPCGLNYFNAHKFRSRCVIEFGPPVQIDQNILADYNGGQRRASIGKVLDQIHTAVRNVTINTPDYETLMMIQAARRLYRPQGKRVPLTAVVELNRRLMKGYEAYKHDTRIVKLKKHVMDYNRRLIALQIRDHQVKYDSLPYSKALYLLVTRLFRLAVMSILVIPGTVLFSPVFILGKIISIRKSKEALAASAVKIEGKDVVATWKLLVALAAAPTFYSLYTIMLTSWYAVNHVQGLISYNIRLSYFAMLSFWFFVGMSFAALRIGEIGMDIIKSIRPLVVALLSPLRGRQLARLRTRREALAAEVIELVNTLGPEIFPDFERKRIILPDATHQDINLARDSGSDAFASEPTTPVSPAYAEFSYGSSPDYLRHLPRDESLHDISNIGMFASRPGSNPATPRNFRSLSRTGSFGTADSIHAFTPLDSKTNMDRLHRGIQQGMRERNRRRKSQGGDWESRSSTPSSEFDGLIMSKKGL